MPPLDSDLRRKSLPFAVKALAADGTFTLYAGVFNNVDRQDEVLAPGCIANLDEFVQSGWGDVNHAWHGLGVATIDSAEQDALGVKITGRFHSTPDAQEVRTKIRERMERGKTAPCSIGYRVRVAASEMRDGKPITVLKAIDLYEFSFVALPANPLAGVTSVKGLVSLDAARTLIAGVKSGRTISKANHAKLSAWADMMHEHGRSATTMAAEMRDWLAGHMPAADDGADAEPDDDPDDLPAKRAALKRRSLTGRAKLPAP